MNWRIFSPNFVPVGAVSCRMVSNGGKHAVIWESEMKGAVIIYHFRSPNARGATCTDVQIAGPISTARAE
jgi:hypothetical protein